MAGSHGFRFRIGILARPYRRLIDRRGVLQIGTGVLIGTLWHPDDVGCLLLTGALADQAALFGVLTQIEALGLELVEVRRCESPGGVTPPHPGTRNAEFS